MSLLHKKGLPSTNRNNFATSVNSQPTINSTKTSHFFFNTAILHIDTYYSVVSVVLAFSASARARAPSAPTSLLPRLRLGEQRARHHGGVGLRMHGPLASLLVLANPSTDLLIRMRKIF